MLLVCVCVCEENNPRPQILLIQAHSKQKAIGNHHESIFYFTQKEGKTRKNYTNVSSQNLFSFQIN